MMDGGFLLLYDNKDGYDDNSVDVNYASRTVTMAQARRDDCKSRSIFKVGLA